MVFLSKFKAVREISPRRKAMQSHFCVWGYFENLLTKLPTACVTGIIGPEQELNFLTSTASSNITSMLTVSCSKRMERM